MIGMSENLAAAVGGHAATLHAGEADEGTITWKPPKEAGLHNSNAVGGGEGKHWYHDEEDEEEPLDPSVLVTMSEKVVFSDDEEDQEAAGAGAAQGAMVQQQQQALLLQQQQAAQLLAQQQAAGAAPTPALTRTDSTDSLFADEPLPVGHIDGQVSGNLEGDAFKETIEENPLALWDAPNEAGLQNCDKVTDAMQKGVNWDK